MQAACIVERICFAVFARNIDEGLFSLAFWEKLKLARKLLEIDASELFGLAALALGNALASKVTDSRM
jgi:hypothetical protein